MKLKDKCIVFALTNSIYAFRNTINEMKNIVLEGGNIIPIMQIGIYETDSKYGKVIDYINEIEDITKRKIITYSVESEREEGDIMVIAPCSRRCYKKISCKNI